MSCRRAESWISLRVDGIPLAGKEARALEEHLRGCASCRAVLEVETGRARHLVSGLGDSALGDSALGQSAPGEVRGPGPLAERILAAAREDLRGDLRRNGPALHRRPFLRPATLSAAATLAVAAIALWWTTIEGPAPGNGNAAYAAGPLQLFIEHEEEDGAPEPGEMESSGIGRKTLRSRRIIFDPLELPAGWNRKDHREPPGVILDLERVDTRYFHYTTVPYR